jgi:hypothetical protein
LARAVLPDVPRQASISERQVVGEDVAPRQPPAIPLARAVLVVTSEGDHALRRQDVFIGNSDSCNIRVPGPRFPKLRATLMVSDSRVVIEQVSGALPILVNGKALSGTRRLFDGDRLLFGSQIVVLFQADLRSERPTVRRSVDALENGKSEAPRSIIRSREPSPEPGLARAAERLLALGRAGEAELLLKGPLERLRTRAREDGALADSVLEWASRCALLLARDMRRGAWLDYVLELHLLAQLPMSKSSVRRFNAARRSVKEHDRLLLATYLRVFSK